MGAHEGLVEHGVTPERDGVDIGPVRHALLHQPEGTGGALAEGEDAEGRLRVSRLCGRPCDDVFKECQSQ